MKIPALLDCWAAVVVMRAGGCYDVPTVDAAIGSEERQRDIIEQSRARMQGWAEADKKRLLYHDEAIDLSIAEILLRVIEQGAPTYGRGRPERVKTVVAAMGARGPAETFCAAIQAEQVMRDYCESTGEGLERIKQAVLNVHPRKGRYSGMTDKGGRWHRHNARYRTMVKKLWQFEPGGTLDASGAEGEKDENAA